MAEGGRRRETPAYAELIDSAVVRRAVAEFRRGQEGHAPLLLSLVMLETWLREYLPRAFAVADAPARAAA
jgi:hypothetical protein